MKAQIGSYRIEKILGHGGMGVVYKGCHDRLGRHAAIKTFLRSDSTTSVQRKRLIAEAQAQASLQHPNIVAVYDLIEDQGELFIAMEYVEGKPLSEILEAARDGRLPLSEALRLIEQILNALEYVHSRSIIHRDIKPSNVMVCDGCVKLMDFGIALLAGNPRLTTHLGAPGTPHYMSPEQLQSKEIDQRSDVYSSAIVLFRMLAGHMPFPAKELLAQIHERLAGAPDLQMIVPELPPGICRAVAIALSYEPRDRFQSAAEFREALKDGNSGLMPLVEAKPVVDPAATIPGATSVSAPPEPPIPPETSKHATAAMWLVVAGSLGVASYVAVSRINQLEMPQTPPPAKTRPTMVVIPTAPAIETTKPTKLPKKREPNLAPKPKSGDRKVPLSEADLMPPRTEAEKLRREIEKAHADVTRLLIRAEFEIGLKQFSEALNDLEIVLGLVQRYPAEFVAEAEKVKTLRARVIAEQLALEDAKRIETYWKGRIAIVESFLVKGMWPEVQIFAQAIVDEKAPEPYLSQAKSLVQKGKEGHAAVFKEGGKVGETVNTIVRKPSSPPRNDK